MRYLIISLFIFSSLASTVSAQSPNKQQPFSSDFGSTSRPHSFINPRTTPTCPAGNPKTVTALLSEFQTCAAQGLPQGCITPTDVQDLICSVQSITTPAKASNTQFGIVQCDGITVQCPAGVLSSGTNVINVRSYGAAGNGTTNDSVAFMNALAACNTAGGGIVYVPPTGHSYILSTGLNNTYNGCSIEGTGGYHQPSNLFDNTEGDWTTAGSWIHCTDTVNPCITMAGTGQTTSGLNFWYTQPTPASTACGASCTMTHAWTPNYYPFTIAVLPSQNGNTVSNNYVVNGTNCIDIEGNSNESLGVNSYGFTEDHNRWGCFNTVQQMRYVDNTISINDWRDQTWWYIGSTDLLGWMEGDATHTGHRIGWDMYYVANLQATNVEFYEDWTGMRGTDATVTSGLGNVIFAAQALQLSNISFNQTCQGIILANGTTHFNGRMTNVIANSDVQTSGVSGQCAQAWPSFFNLASDNMDVAINNLDGYTFQTIATIGNGTSGALHLAGNVRGSYSAWASGAHAFVVNANGAIDMPNDYNAIFPGSGAGTVLSGSPNWPIVSAGGQRWLTGAAGTARQEFYLSNSISRWSTTTDPSAETGSNTGSNFGIYRYADNGNFVDIPFGITRSTGTVAIKDGLVIVPLPTSCSGQATGTIYNTQVAATGGGSAIGVCP